MHQDAVQPGGWLTRSAVPRPPLQQPSALPPRSRNLRPLRLSRPNDRHADPWQLWGRGPCPHELGAPRPQQPPSQRPRLRHPQQPPPQRPRSRIPQRCPVGPCLPLLEHALVLLILGPFLVCAEVHQAASSMPRPSSPLRTAALATRLCAASWRAFTPSPRPLRSGRAGAAMKDCWGYGVSALGPWMATRSSILRQA